MAMNIPASGGDEEQAIAAINTTPLVDVMLVLLIIFLITIPVVNYSVPVAVPKERNEVRESKPETVVISVDAAGRTYWYDTPVQGTPALVARLTKVAALNPQPEVHIRGDWHSDYEPVGRIIYACQAAGIAKVGFITEPPARN
ncbi:MULTISPECIES: biopolymer transporter ExbD [Variovorax]|uniref:Biopolymer transport protein ExbD n=2 Tax=Variovorax boronicumulans TaxID=436515 RepID=A0AAW8DYK5_9BURK|nr:MULTISPECIES: biopolymer transporter ExbD [Variovorax]MDP9879427.1 biopolymer transport protein ExbD [Variovorax boronicumulans]MDP9918476.1 biopolymer transport protein ExbD [Variovorax boronicumulans]MDP9924896.1 biopolymer transport protein ExbD [Variovorax boronicumulans]TSD56319.1 biopolymer transporter ExbD [Variovorax sp. KBS0712]GER09035.1 biopolymer transporter ExbD [Variovorax boronicumulans]